MSAWALLLGAMLLSGESSLWLYRGGFIVFVLLSVVLLFAATQSSGSLPRWLSQPPLVWLGKRSYAPYLFWPLYTSDASAPLTRLLPRGSGPQPEGPP